MTAPFVFEVEVSGVNAAIEVESPSASFSPSDPTVVFAVSPGPQGAKGDAGNAGDASPVFDETPSGSKDGTNAVFTLQNSFKPGSVRAYRNGLREIKGIGLLETGNSEITFTTPPRPDDVLTVDYLIQ
ncbi:hypothetical protein [Mycobacterium sp. CnD-18-1]|uniref:hypothetical protein n=1 Tax=Mycobacterium sp. CnD-18-1 TaxID=2917744 RepID=UPI001EF19A89|nr:hypothetical protein [Mycobacterium sp. CnD-18-1]MCG7607073.1 hypothetical protein [Mycobacterium sp. CnD-18-1]